MDILELIGEERFNKAENAIRIRGTLFHTNQKNTHVVAMQGSETEINPAYLNSVIDNLLDISNIVEKKMNELGYIPVATRSGQEGNQAFVEFKRFNQRQGGNPNGDRNI